MRWFRLTWVIVVPVLVWWSLSYYQSTFPPIDVRLAEQAKWSYRVSSIVAAVFCAMVVGLVTDKNVPRATLVGMATVVGYYFLWILWSRPQAVDGPWDEAWVIYRFNRDVTQGTLGAITGAACMTLLLDTVQIIRGKLRRRARRIT